MPAAFYLILLVAAIGMVYLRWQFSGDTREDKKKKVEKIKKDEALEKFKKVHSQVRDKRKQVAKKIAEDPERATRVLRNMMKK